MNKILKFILLLSMAVALSTSVVATSDTTVDNRNFVIDQAGAFSEQETQMLMQEATRISDLFGTGLYVMTIDGYNAENFYDLAESYFFDYALGFGANQDGILTLIDTATNQATFYNYSVIDIDITYEIYLDSIETDLAIGDYYTYAMRFLDGVEQDFTYVMEADTRTQEAVDDLVISSVMDTADILTDEEEDSLRAISQEIVDEHEIATYILTVEDFNVLTDTGDAYYAATEFYAENDLGYGEDRNGVLLLLSMSDRDYGYISYGDKANFIFSNNVKISVEEYFLPKFAEEDWYGGFFEFLDETEFEMSYYIVAQLFIVGICAVIAVVIAFAVVGVHKNALKSVKSDVSSTKYIADDLINISIKDDRYTHTTESKVRIQTSSGSSGGSGRSYSGGGFSGRSGKF